MWKAYLGDLDDLGDQQNQSGQQSEKIEYASPIEAESFERFPPTYIEVAQYDALRDEGIALCNRLKEEGIACELHEILCACHGFETARKSNIMRTCMDRRINWLKDLFR